VPENASFHENFERAEGRNGASSRAFGLLISAAFAIIAARPLLSGGGVRWWALAVAAALVLVSIARPALLDAPKRLWLRLGGVLGRIVNPVVLGILFVAVVTPTALVTRMLGHDPLRLRVDRGAPTYWIERKTIGAGRVDMRKQF
jgi:hypothetical protein